MEELINYLSNKKILILGFGREGKSSYEFIKKHLPQKELFIADEKTEIDYSFDDNDKLILGKDYLNCLEQFDLILKTPGISFKGINTDSFKEELTSQLELLLEFYPNQTIGVTGTKGKSTTSSLIYKILKDQNQDAILMGNIGIPVFDHIEEIKENTKIVLEMSSHQLQYMKKSTNISLLLNVYQEHLDHYNSYDEYIDAKCNIFKFQAENDYFIYDADSEIICDKTRKINPASIKYAVTLEENKVNDNSVYLKDNMVCIDGEIVYDANQKRKLIGNHNLNDIMFALVVARILGLNMEEASKTINEFEPLAHRLEYAGRYNGIVYYNDSISTIPMATINAVEALKNVSSLIIGGMDRGIDYSELIEYLNTSKIDNLICLPTTGHIIGNSINNQNIKVFLVENMKEAVDVAKKNTKPDKICLLSPAAASYGFFKNFEDRGKQFKELVKE